MWCEEKCFLHFFSSPSLEKIAWVGKKQIGKWKEKVNVSALENIEMHDEQNCQISVQSAWWEQNIKDKNGKWICRFVTTKSFLNKRKFTMFPMQKNFKWGRGKRGGGRKEEGKEEEEERVGKISWLPEFQVAELNFYSLKKKWVSMGEHKKGFLLHQPTQSLAISFKTYMN